MPSVLFEAGYLSNPTTKRCCLAARAGALIAEAHGRAIEAYFAAREAGV